VKQLALLALLAAPALGADARTPGETFQDCPDCPTMVVVPAGAFDMGSTPEERAREGVPASFGDHEGPVRRITFARPFAVARTETTRAQYARFVAATKRPVDGDCIDYNAEEDSWAGTPGKQVSWRDPGFPQTDDHPVVCISWRDATDYAAWLAKTTGQRYRLASEAEWEYAARAGTTTARPWGDSVTPICTKAAIMTSASWLAIAKSDSWTDELVCSSDKAYTLPVASFDPNPWGLHDMLGNVWEWVADCAAKDHATLPADGTAQVEGGDCEQRLSKGGAWHSRTWLARPATRGSGQSGVNRPVAAGIRVVRDL
jgi:formylglycine-generating enzyme required for sulfatase activity